MLWFRTLDSVDPFRHFLESQFEIGRLRLGDRDFEGPLETAARSLRIGVKHGRPGGGHPGPEGASTFDNDYGATFAQGLADVVVRQLFKPDSVSQHGSIFHSMQ